MKRKPKALGLYSPGTNCEDETLAAFNLAGASASLVFLNDIIQGKSKITDCDIFFFPGGFSYGDNVDTGIIVAVLIRDFIPELLNAKIPIIGICNGFQIMMRAGMFGQGITLTHNDSGLFCSRPTKHKVLNSTSIWTKGLSGEILSFPSAHQAGKVVGKKTPNTVLTYASESPNGGSIAGICSDDGLILGLMDHPERPYGNVDGQKIFRNGVSAV